MGAGQEGISTPVLPRKALLKGVIRFFSFRDGKRERDVGERECGGT